MENLLFTQKKRGDRVFAVVPFQYVQIFLIECLERLIEVVDDVIDVLRTDGEADGRRRDAGGEKLFFAHLGVRRGCRMDDERFDVGDVREQGEDFEVVDELLCRLGAALDFKREDRDAAIREIFFVKLVIRMVGDGRMIDLLNMRILREVVDDFERVLDMALDAQRQRLDALQQQERIERRNRRARVAQQQRTQIDDKRRRANVFREAQAVVADVLRDEPRELARRRPVEFAAVDDDAAERRAVAADELRRRMHDDVRAVVERAQLVRRRERGIDNERDLVRMRDFRDSLDVDEVRVRIADGLDVDDLRVVLNGILEDLRALRRIDERRLDAEIGERVLEEVERATVDRRGRDDVLARMDETLNGCRDCRRAGCERERRDAAFERREAFLEHILRRVRQTAVDVARILQAETVSGVLAVLEDIARRLVDRHGARIRRGISLFLADMQLQRLKVVLSLFAHNTFLLYLTSSKHI